MDTPINRRSLVVGGATLGGELLLAGPLQAILARPTYAQGAGYGPIAPVKDHRTGTELLALPKGFEYWSIGEELSLMSDGQLTPPRHDGMAAFQYGQKIHLVRNHEVTKAGPAFGPADKAYDPQGGGGTTTIIFDPQQPKAFQSFAGLSGTSNNCAGGRTPRRTWLSCEETVAVDGSQRPHGFVFEVPSDGTVPNARPLTALGRFRHEAVAVDPSTWIVYLTEDDGRTSGLYRFVPQSPGNLDAGRLQMLAIEGKPQAKLFSGQKVGVPLPVAWVDIDVPAPDPVTPDTSVFRQGRKKEAAAFSRLEGAWWSRQDGTVYFTATDGGDAKAGQVWALTPGLGDGAAKARDTLSLVYESLAKNVLFKPDNITVSPGGGLLVCEDPDHAQQAFIRGVTQDGKVYDFAKNIRPGVIPDTTDKQSEDEFTGATFSRDGKWLFVNIQTPGITFAITGPFENGPLGRQGQHPDPEHDW